MTAPAGTQALPNYPGVYVIRSGKGRTRWAATASVWFMNDHLAIYASKDREALEAFLEALKAPGQVREVTIRVP